MKPNIPSRAKPTGFALVISLSLMVLLTVLCIGLLSLSSISLRASTQGAAQAEAYANARLSIMLALGDLQKHAGDDRRITADASIDTAADGGQPRLVGVWNSWSPDFAASPTQNAPNYATQKTGNFRTWLASAPDSQELKNRDFANTAPSADAIDLFTADHDGFELGASKVEIDTGAFAWAVSQENTRAKINIAGPDASALAGNAALQAQQRPSLALAKNLKNPDTGWNLRSGRLLSFNQIGLDTEMGGSPETVASTGPSYTVHAQGLLTDAVRGGLKTDLNLGFELSDSEFDSSTLGDVPNPFRAANSNTGFSPPSTYDGQRALFLPLHSSPIVAHVEPDEGSGPADVAQRLFAAGVPTFNHLRSFYRTAHYIYGGAGDPTVAERGAKHAALPATVAGATSGSSLPAGRPPRGGDTESRLGIRPVLNRVAYLIGMSVGDDNLTRVHFTPIISLWNPYNTSLEMKGAVVYPWADMPFVADWTIRSAAGADVNQGGGMANSMGAQFASVGHGRSVDPYFFCALTAGGSNTGSGTIRFEPGEIRVFAPATSTPVDFIKTASVRARTVFLTEVSAPAQFSTRGGLAVRTDGSNVPVKPTDKVKLRFSMSNGGNTYPYFITMEDATRVTAPTTPGEVLSEIQVPKLTGTSSVESAFIPYSELKTGVPQPIAVIETYHATTGPSVLSTSSYSADLVYTTNPRQPSTARAVSNGTFRSAPNYVTAFRGITSRNAAIEVTSDGRRSFWGNNHSSAGKTHLPFFEVPRQPLLSLAGFQNADLASSAYSTAHQVATSRPSPYLGQQRVATATVKSISPTGSTETVPAPAYDTAYLANEALWDGFFFSGAAPTLTPGTNANPATVWAGGPIARSAKPLDSILREFVENPLEKPLANPRMRLHTGSFTEKEVTERLLDPAGCTRIAAHLMVDGAFNVNSTDVEAWKAMLTGLRGQSFEVQGGSSPTSETAFPRFRHPTSSASPVWNGFRSLNDNQIATLATNIVNEVRKRGPFLSLAEFVNRRVVANDPMGRTGAIQSAIDSDDLNTSALQRSFAKNLFPTEAQNHIVNNTGVGLPGYLTQADVLQSLAPVITARSDTFTIRGYGEARDSKGQVTARTWCEAVVQRVPDFVDPTNRPETPVASVTQLNKTFGRRFEIISFRQIPRAEVKGGQTI